ncbi:MAG: family serine peptidase, partial [Thermodesulfobacteriota bacterium]|nr:family serine peptidase [Thermodesulfobacteriota bacterium]
VAQQQGIDVPNLGNFVTLHFPADADTESIAQELSQLPEVERAVAVPKAIPPQTPLNEPLVGTTDQVVLNPTSGLENQWYIHRCRANKAWNMASGKGVVIADIDWGYRISHQDLASKLDLSRAYNAYDGGTNVSTGGSVSHGTAVMGIAGGASNNLGIAGFGYNATLWPVQADTGPGTALGGNAWARAIDWVRSANSNGRRKVIILEVQTGSYGNYEMVPSVNAAIRTAIANGVVVCVAAGNGNRNAGVDDSGNPIPETGSILVGATEYNSTQNRRASFSNFGPRVVVCAPGDGSHDLTCSSSSDSAYRNGFGGTSGATPKVAGTVSLMLDVNPNLTHVDIRAFLICTGTAVVTDAGKPVGTFLNAEAAVQEALRRTAGGRLEVFARGSDKALWHMWQTAPNNGWSGWASLGGWIDRLQIGQNADGRLEVFARGSDGALWHMWQTAPSNGWSGWASLGGWIDSPVAARNADGRLEVFVIGSDHALWHMWQTAPNSGWSSWASLGGWIDRLEIGQNADGRLEVFARGSDAALWHMWQTAPSNGWSGWASLGGWIDQLTVGQNKG